MNYSKKIAKLCPSSENKRLMLQRLSKSILPLMEVLVYVGHRLGNSLEEKIKLRQMNYLKKLATWVVVFQIYRRF